MTRILILAALLASCANLPGDPSKLSAEQLREIAKDRGASAACTVITTPWGPQRTVYVQMDKGTVPSGNVTMTQDCQVSITADPAAAKAAAAPATSFSAPAAGPTLHNCYRSGPPPGTLVCEVK